MNLHIMLMKNTHAHSNTAAKQMCNHYAPTFENSDHTDRAKEQRTKTRMLVWKTFLNKRRQ